jgi:hypothetical protein
VSPPQLLPSQSTTWPFQMTTSLNWESRLGLGYFFHGHSPFQLDPQSQVRMVSKEHSRLYHTKWMHDIKSKVYQGHACPMGKKTIAYSSYLQRMDCTWIITSHLGQEEIAYQLVKEGYILGWESLCTLNYFPVCKCLCPAVLTVPIFCQLLSPCNWWIVNLISSRDQRSSTAPQNTTKEKSVHLEFKPKFEKLQICELIVTSICYKNITFF